ncbi:MAG TPA: TIGR00730 family Rossman fold protein [Vicinamibacterales bacterium]|nr:TIGR00730 family Rossman fold protein [Vicinamibacterales bacterium]
MRLTRICVFCGSSTGTHPDYRAAAERLGAELARRGIGLVFGGGKVGLMGVVADAVLAGGGEVVGVIPESLALREVAHDGLTDLRIVGSMHERKALMAELADAFLALPGGFGTFEEFCEAITWTQLGLHRKRCGLLNVRGFYDPLLALFDRAVADGFLRPQNRGIVLSSDDPPTLLDRLAEPFQPIEPKWIRGAGDT